MIGYLSGPITGNSNYEQQFSQAAEALARGGRDVINPTALDWAIPLEELSYEKIMEIDLKLLSMADYLVQLPGWKDSRGGQQGTGLCAGHGPARVLSGRTAGRRESCR